MKEIYFKRVHTYQGQYYTHPELIKEERITHFNFAVGDMVTIHEYLCNFDASTGAKKYGNDPELKEKSAIVLDTDCDKWVWNEGGYVQTDLLLDFGNGTKVYCASFCVNK